MKASAGQGRRQGEEVFFFFFRFSLCCFTPHVRAFLRRLRFEDDFGVQCERVKVFRSAGRCVLEKMKVMGFDMASSERR